MEQAVSHNGFGALLKQWRAQRKLSQLELALSCNVSQRHVSFLESGRARPSRTMVLQLGEAMEIPLRDCNALLQAAGFSPVFAERDLAARDMAPVRQALDLVLAHHDPCPAIVVDRHWDLVDANAATLRLFALLGDVDAMWEKVNAGRPANILRFTFHPEGLQPYINNWHELAPAMLQRLQREAFSYNSDILHALAEEFRTIGSVDEAWLAHDPSAPLLPVIPMSISTGGATVRLFSMITTFGTPQDITTDELRVESFFPMDSATESLLRSLAEK